MSSKKKWRVYLIVLSDLGAQGKREDTAGESVKSMLKDNNFIINDKIIIPDDFDSLVAILKKETDPDYVQSDVIFTIGGTGLSPRDITPQATKLILDIEIPGLTELMRIKGYELNRLAIISRSVAGIRNNVLIINLPGSKRGATESLGLIIEQIDHLLNQIQNKDDNYHENLKNEN
ncbi:MAG: molybdenum cofactor biosynthesis protein [Chloroflexi bacterium]|nr:molybdenum cofactor biosynthesis protein [Chloroflexota bacterium]|tara:strand:- start:733 stop:1260 length:528 start_codon:yes stop_codon:yes gene_type:complete